MWTPWHGAAAAPLSEKLRRRLLEERGLSDRDAAPLRTLQERGLYAGRKVMYFLVFDPATLSGRGAAPRHPGDLDPRQVLHSGHVERDGEIVLDATRREA